MSSTTSPATPPNQSTQPAATPDQILQIGFGFWASKTLLSAVEMEVFTELAKRPEDLETLSGRLGLHPRSARDFLDALVAMEFLRREDGVYSNTPATDLYLDKHKPSYIGGILEMCNHRSYGHWNNLTEALRTGLPQNELKGGGAPVFETIYADPDQYHFGGLDYEYKVGTNGGALARYRMYYNTTGSWMSPDPSGVSYDFTNPQSFNRYSYTLNNPVSLTDPTGQFTCPACTAPIGIACPWCAVGAAVGGLIYDLGKVFCWWGCHHPAFHGSLKPRPNAQPWDENHIHWWNGANLATALGLPDEGCDFGACGGAGNALESGAASQGSCDSSQLTCILSSATPYIPYVSMALFSAKPFIQNTTSQGKCSDMRSSTFFCGYTCTFSNGEELPSVVYNKVQMRIGCGQWSCAVGFDATMNSTHLIVPGAFDWWTTAVNINSGTCVYPSNP